MLRKLNISTVVGLVLGLIALVAVFSVLRKSSNTETVYIARSYVPARQIITTADLTTATMSPADVPAGTLFGYSEIVGHYATSPVFPGQTFLAAALGSSNTAQALVAGLAPDERAFAVAANVDQAIAGQIAPGDEVDVVVAQGGSNGGSIAGAPASPKVSTIIQHVSVLAVNTSQGTIAQPTNATSSGAAASAANSGSNTAPGIYTLALTPSEVQQVTLAETVGTIYLSLDPVRHPSVYSGGASGMAALNGSKLLGPTVPSAALAAKS